MLKGRYQYYFIEKEIEDKLRGVIHSVTLHSLHEQYSTITVPAFHEAYRLEKERDHKLANKQLVIPTDMKAVKEIKRPVFDNNNESSWWKCQKDHSEEM